MLHRICRCAGVGAPVVIFSGLLLALSCGPTMAASGDGLKFPTPDAAVTTLVDATRAADREKLLSIFGHDAVEELSSGDEVADEATRKRFVALYDEAHKIVASGLDRAELTVGKHDWPFPIPIVRDGKSWTFDAKAGREEIINRRIGRNELNAMESLRVALKAQGEYYRTNPAGDARQQYAQRFLSTEGNRDGLYWPVAEGEQPSPLGPLVGEATAEGYQLTPLAPAQPPRPFHGYLFRILTSQGANAEGGALDYLENGALTKGFAIVAYPVKYGVSGIRTFLVNQDGVLFERDLGPDTDKIAAGIRAFDPDEEWSAHEE
ncbi:MAG: DUF2950 domain-containing protein [Candidatus Riflebacteria bacterium]|nr:DUF2950 domain-containing protein [Candidatus Riflebacteria bacterium]